MKRIVITTALAAVLAITAAPAFAAGIFVNQVGFGNQVGGQQIGAGNTIGVDQNGVWNDAIVQQFGNGNVGAVGQHGFNNGAEAVMAAVSA